MGPDRPYDSCGRGPTGSPAAVYTKNKFFGQEFGLKSDPDGSGHAIRFIWSYFRAKRSILDPFRNKFDVFGPARTLADLADMSR